MHNAGRVLGNALTRFEARVLELMAQAGHAQTRLPHINLTRHLDRGGTRITVLARRANMTNAAMTELIDQCEGLGLVIRLADPSDRRARVVNFTDAGQVWLAAFSRALKKAERELVEEIGADAAATLFGALARYAGVVASIGGEDGAA
ncbi:MAG: winged helix DNA-binding protein [Hydrogenophaga sp.]|jgi:DNA-binding MarR family transcriptional regulator|nr:winged helix DNA-binding protein [Hydrogenophaga sp.]MDZ4361221.1 winged helix DNA-binding protein [Variovorax sp.]RJP69938.1 MAG: MarR family transcriptional regulator [Comamonadaceae bacterium]